MRIIHTILAVCMLLLVAACGTPTAPTSGGSDAAPAQAGAASDATTSETAAAGSGNETLRQQYAEAPQMGIDPAKTYNATIQTTKGTMKVELFAKDAPLAVNNFVFLARENFYDGIRFHRIIKNFMVQTGDPNGDGSGGPGYSFPDEPVEREYTRGTLAMANSGPDTNGSQFFIVHADSALPKDYTIFGQVAEGLEVLDAIADTPVALDPQGIDSLPSVPQEEVQIVDIAIEEA